MGSENTPAQVIELALVGNDRPGIISEISQVLTKLSINFEQLITECVSAPMSGDFLFKAIANVTLPKDLEIDALKEGLESLADDLVVEIRLK